MVGFGEPGVGPGRTPALDLVAVPVGDVQAPGQENKYYILRAMEWF